MAAKPRADKGAARAVLRGFLMTARFSLLLLLAVATVAPAIAQERLRPAQTEPASDVLAESITHHRYRAGQAEAAFTVTAGTLPLGDAKGEHPPSMFYVAYTRDGAARDARPLTFVFNGGPGASSAYLHLGALGPRVVEFGSGGQMPAPPVHLIDNPDSWLDLTDLVFIDPPGTGYSTSDEQAKKYYAVREDLQAFASFIDLYLKRNDRVSSPKYIVGESYGGFRATRLPQILADDHGISLTGVFMISPAMEFSLIGGNEFEPLPYALRLPSYAAAVLERKGALAPAALVDAERFALGPYLAALVATPRDPAVMKQVLAEVARYTGLPEELVTQHDGLITPGLFVKESHRADGQLASRYDASVTGLDPYPATSDSRQDPIYNGLIPVLTAAVHEHLGNALGVKTTQPYRVSNGEATRQWNWRSGINRGGYVGGADSLREALAANPQLKVIVAHGMTDLVTPYMTSRFVIDRLPASLTEGRVTLNLYAGGHMMYLRSASRARLHADAAKLYPVPPL
jgi:carboxypeptidase C (cathepsin A)